MDSFQPQISHKELELPYKAAEKFCSNHFTCQQVHFVGKNDFILTALLEKIQYTLLKQKQFFILFDASKQSDVCNIEPLLETPVLFLLNIQAWQEPSVLESILQIRSNRGMRTLITSTYPSDLLHLYSPNTNRKLERLLKDSIVIFIPEASSLTFNLFVYGTLKRDFSNHHYLKNATFLGKSQTVLPYPMILKHKAYPYLINKPNKGLHIKGELYHVDYATLLAIDELEGCPDNYIRSEIAVQYENNNQVNQALVYFLKDKIKYNQYEFFDIFEETLS